MLVSMVILAVLAGLGATVWALADPVRAEWTCRWRGRTIKLVARQNAHTVYMDGLQVARKTTLARAGTSLVWTVEAEGRPVVLTANVVYTDGGGPMGRIFADGAWIGGVESGASAVLAAAALGRTVGAGAEPTDRRWAAASLLLADLRATQDPSHGEAAQRIDAGLRGVLGGLERLAAAQEAHQALGGDQSSMADARAHLEGQAVALLAALRDFHLLALTDQGAPSLDRLNDLLARAEADAEIEGRTARRLAGGVAERS